MVDLLTLSIGLGLIVCLIFSETLGKTAGGLVVPGYLALSLMQPVNIALTFLVAFLTFAIVRGLSSVMIVYGKRRVVLTLLIGFAVTTLFRGLIGITAGSLEHPEFAIIGFIVPSLIALWMDRQGWLDTCTTTLTAAAVVRLALVLVLPDQLQQAEALRKADEQKPPVLDVPNTPTETAANPERKETPHAVQPM